VAYTFDQIFAADPANPANVAAGASVLIFAPADATMTPLTITAPDGTPLANPVQVNANGFGSAFTHATLDRVAWAGGGFSGFFTSYDGMKAATLDAQGSASSSAQAAAASAAAATAAAANAAAASGISILPDPSNPGLYFITSSGQLVEDPANPGFYLTGL